MRWRLIQCVDNWLNNRALPYFKVFRPFRACLYNSPERAKYLSDGHRPSFGIVRDRSGAAHRIGTAHRFDVTHHIDPGHIVSNKFMFSKIARTSGRQEPQPVPAPVC